MQICNPLFGGVPEVSGFGYNSHLKEGVKIYRFQQSDRLDHILHILVPKRSDYAGPDPTRLGSCPRVCHFRAKWRENLACQLCDFELQRTSATAEANYRDVIETESASP